MNSATKVHFRDPMSSTDGTACGLALGLLSSRVSTDLEQVTCKVCLRIATQGR